MRNPSDNDAYDPSFYTGPQWAITQTDKGGTNQALNEGKMALLTHGRDAAILGGRVGSLFDYSSADPAQKAALEKELQRRHDIEAATRKRKVQQSITKVLAAAAIGGAIAAAAPAAAGAAGSSAAGGGAGAAGAAGGTGAAAGGGTAAATGGVGAAGGGLGAAGGVSGAATGGTVAGVGAAGGAASGAAGGGAAASGGGAAAGGFGWKDAAKIGLDAYGGYKQAEEAKKAAADAAKGKSATTMRTPYGNEYISLLIPYILQNLQNVFQSRMSTYGAQAANFDIYRQLLGGIPSTYSGVGMPGSPVLGR